MKLCKAGLSDAAWKQAGVKLPEFDIDKMRAATEESPVWVHFGAGNIFRGFIAVLQQRLLEQGLAQQGIIAADTFDYDIIDKIYTPFDNMTMMVSLKPDGSMDREIIASVAKGVKANMEDEKEYSYLKKVFANPSLQMLSFTITEKGYALANLKGEYLPVVTADIENGPTKAHHAMSIVAALLLERYNTCKAPIAVVSMDNCSHNGEKLKHSVVTIVEEWLKKGHISADFAAWVKDENQVSFPWSMIDKITPRPAESVCRSLEELGIEDIAPVITSKNTYIAPFVNAEGPQYLVIEDHFPNGRPALEKAGVYMTDRDTVNKVERMKVTTCLNPLHTALAVYGCVLGYTLIADEMKDEELNRLVHEIGPVEGMPVVTDPGILSPEAFVDEVINVRIPNPFMPDTPQRIATDTSQKVGIRYGETIKAYVAQYGDAEKLKAIPLAIAGWCRYLLGVDDKGEKFELSSDPMLAELTAALKDVKFGEKESYTGQLKSILSNENIFGIDLYKAGIGEKIEELFVKEIAGPGAVRKTLQETLNK